MKTLTIILLGVVIVCSMVYIRLYTIEFATKSFGFGCETAAQKLEKTDILGGEQLKAFCEAYTRNIRKYY